MKIIQYENLTPELARAGCFVAGMPNEVYHAYEGISNSGLKQVEISPAHYAFKEPTAQTPAMRLGSAIHCAILEPHVFESEYLLLPEAKDRRCAAFNQAAKHHDKDKIITAGDIANVKGMQDSFLSNRAAQSYLDCEYWTELSAFVECPVTGVLLRVRFDIINERFEVLDLKKTTSAQYDDFSKSIYNYGYHQQAAFYNDVFELIMDEPLKKFSFFAIEDKSPYASKVWRLDDESILMGRCKYQSSLGTFAYCEQTGNWPAYPDSEDVISLPEWAISKHLNDSELEIVYDD